MNAAAPVNSMKKNAASPGLLSTMSGWFGAAAAPATPVANAMGGRRSTRRNKKAKRTRRNKKCRK